MGKPLLGFLALIFLGIMHMFYKFPAFSELYQYDNRYMNSSFTNETLQNKPQLNAITNSRKRHLKYLKEFPNVPFKFLYEMKNNYGQYCYDIEENEGIIYNERNIYKLFNITITNQYWQEYISRSGMIYLYNAYLDTRGNYSMIQIIAIAERQARNDVNKCAIWYKNSADPDISSETMEMNPIREHWWQLFIGIQNSARVFDDMAVYILTCKIPNRRNRIPQVVSIVDHMDIHIHENSNCYETANYLKVNHNYEEKKDFAVCVKGYFFQKSHSTQLIEWIELLSILGAKKIFLYELEGNRDVRKVFDFYSKKGILDVRKFTFPGDPNFRNSSYLKKHLHPLRIDAHVVLNDCLYRNIHRYKFIVNTDIDEVIIPRELGHTWIDMMKSSLSMYENAKSYYFQSTYFFDDVPEYKQSLNRSMYDIPRTNHMLRHVYRSKNLGKGKSFLNTKFVNKVNSHKCMNMYDSLVCNQVKIKSTIALVHHYRKGCQDYVKNCDEQFRQDILLDTRLWEFKDQLVLRSKETLSKLHIEV